MDNQPSNVNFWDELGKWLELPPEDELHGDSATNGGGSGSRGKPMDSRRSTPETESKCMAVRIASKI